MGARLGGILNLSFGSSLLKTPKALKSLAIHPGPP